LVNCFVGRQPIFNRNNEVYAYELLYRSSLKNAVGDVDFDVATSQLIMNAFIEIGLENIVGHRLAFLNMTRQFLVTPDLMCFPPEQVVLELPSELPIDDEIRNAVFALKAKDYTISLDDYTSESLHTSLLPIADVVKLDAYVLSDEQMEEELLQLRSRDLMLMAKRVETQERRDKLQELGFDYFQGHYSGKPSIVEGGRLPTNKTAVLRLMNAVGDPDTELDEIEKLISMDASLALRVVRFVNSPLSGLVREVESIREAVLLLGRNLLKKWISLLALADLDDAVPEVITMAFVRARLCELLATETGHDDKDSFFTVGLFSMLDAMLGQPMDDLLDSLPFTEDMKLALAHYTGVKGEALMCACNLEVGAPEGVKFEGVDEHRVAELYVDALQWADQTVATVSQAA
jgi:EAL and modified HD-GYP domain-containing signal transduction protein